MGRKRVSEHQLALDKHLRAPERQRLADKLEAEISRREDQLRLCQCLIKAEEEVPLRAPSFWQLLQERARVRELKAEEVRLREEIERLKNLRAQFGLGKHSKFRTPVIEGYGLADAIRAEEKRVR